MTHTTVETWTKTADISGAQPIPRRYHKAKYYPDRLEVEYESRNGAPWDLISLTLAGPSVTKNGPSERSRQVENYARWSVRDAPQWAREWAEANKPREVNPS